MRGHFFGKGRLSCAHCGGENSVDLRTGKVIAIYAGGLTEKIQVPRIEAEERADHEFKRFGYDIERYKREATKRALKVTGGNINEAKTLLQISYRTLLLWVNKWDLRDYLRLCRGQLITCREQGCDHHLGSVHDTTDRAGNSTQDLHVTQTAGD